MNRYCIIGNGPSGIEAALAIRQTDTTGSIDIISGSHHPYYYRPKLIDFIKEELSPEKLYIYKDEFFSSRQINQHLGQTITKIDTSNRSLTVDSGAAYQYDKLLFATGAAPFFPRIDNGQVDGVFTLRGIDDAQRIRTYCKGVRHIVISGAGLLGLETAHALSHYCENITVIETEGFLLNRQLDQAGAVLLLKLLEQKGLSFIFRDCVSSVNGNNRIESVTLKSGAIIQADVMLVSAGVRSNIKLAKDSGVRTERGIVVDNFMRTSAEGIYAAGDCCEYNGRCYGLWAVAREQGRIAGLNMAGAETGYSGSIPSTVLKVTGIDLFSAGDFNAVEGNVLVRSMDDRYIRIVVKEDKPVGAIVIGDSDIAKLTQKVMSGKGTGEEIKAALLSRDSLK
jgi:nitrite reductase (NADH) large subunit